ncbi:hypothetical protein GJ700_11110 [Duganella sp. FT92W]|uniref:Phage tail tape measure protein domain-containing protein n=1 Tax=Pseudoduganella rivuli TaxID=2666085 RepID=A0A7X2IMM4_9BURK|nr:hypothetical protein [Pseudoduganella rivuli]MRV72263.1 hypothetical protein [Pseudoduganella rivuli]
MAGNDELVANGKDRIELGTTLKDGGPAAIGSIFAKAETNAATYQAIIRDIAVLRLRQAQVATGRVAEVDEALERTVAGEISKVAQQEGLDRNVLGPAIGQMLGDLKYADALALAPVMAKFAVGQKADAGASAALVARLNKDFGVDAKAMPVALSRLAAFSKDNGVEGTELVKAVQVLLDDLKFIGYTDTNAAQRALAMLHKGMDRYGSASSAASHIHQDLQKSLGNGSAAARQRAIAKVKNESDLKDGIETVDDDMLNRDQRAQRGLSGAKWQQTGDAVRDASVEVGNVLKPATDAAAGALKDLAVSAGALATENPAAVKVGAVAVTVVGTVLAAMAARSMASGVVSAGKGLFGNGKAAGGMAAGAAGSPQPVLVTNWPGGAGLGLDPGGGKGRKARRTAAASRAAARGQPRNAQMPQQLQRPPGMGTEIPARERGLAARARSLASRMPGRALARTAVSRAGLLVRGASLIGAAWGTYQAADAVLRGNSEAERKRGIKMGLAMAAGAVIGGVLVPGIGIAGGAAAGHALYQMFGTSEEEAKAEEKKRAGKASPGVVAPPASAVAAVPGNTPAKAAGAPSQPTAAARLSAVLPGAALAATAVTVDATRHGVGGVSATAAARESMPQANAISSQQLAPAGAPGKCQPCAPAMPQPAPQLHFNPNITVTVQGDVREPRRIAEELMPYLRQLFDQFQGQQQRSSLFDAPLTAGGIAT